MQQRPAARRFGFFPSEPAQRHRMRRYFMAASTSVVTVALVFVAAWGGLLAYQAALQYAMAILVYVVFFYVVFRSGVNQRAADPSLTFYMTLASLLMILFVVAVADRQHEALMFLVILSFLFGVFRLTTREWIVLSALVSGAYAAILFYSPATGDAVLQAREKVALWIFATVVFLLCSLVGGYISKLRLTLAASTKQLQQLVQVTHEQVIRDELTGAFNRRHMIERLKDEIARARRYRSPLSIAVLDLDFFKRINDTYGHPAGDAVLRAVSLFVPTLLRATDVFARIGGEEFMLLLPETDLRGARGLAERVRVGVSHVAIDGLPVDFRIALSAGVSELVQDEVMEAWLKRTDLALYRAKEAGRNRVETDPGAETAALAERPVAR
jgi:diguanylate cyclase (GGDEF)-like protein